MSTRKSNSSRIPHLAKGRKIGRAAGAAIAAAALAGTSACGNGGAEAEFPSDTIEMIIPYAAGGSTDVSVRQMASIAEDTCGTNVIASNQTGSAGAVGFTATQNAEPDGYTVGATAMELSILHQLGTTEVGPADLKGVMRYALNPHVFYVPADSPYKSMDDVIAAAKDGESINVATAGAGSAAHLSFSGVALQAGVPDQFINLPFDGDASALQATVGGQADMAVMILSTALPQVESGTIRPIAVADEERLDEIPDIPTLTEAGIDWSSGAHLGLAVPLETPDDRVQVLDECIHEAIESDEFQQSMEEQKLNIDYLPPAEFDQYLADLSEQYAPVIEKVGLAK